MMLGGIAALPSRPVQAQDLARAAQTARDHSPAVDSDGRFPAEAIGVLREIGALGALVPADLGGGGLRLRDVAAVCHALGRCCSSTAMILAMHHIQVASLVAHGLTSPWQRGFLRRVAEDGLLLASVTSEVGTGGNMRTSLCAVEPGCGPGFKLTKHASAISYGARADALIVTARTCLDSVASDQVLVVVPTEPGVLARTGAWDTMGMRGTESGAFTLTASGSVDQVLPTPFSIIAAQTMVPVSHLLWASLWCGIAADALTRAHLMLRGRMRAARGGIPDGAGRLVHATERLQALEALVRQTFDRYEQDDPDSFATAANTNMLKTVVSDACLEIADQAMLVCGFAGYSNQGPFSVSRHVRDLHSARLMVHNDRIRSNTAQLLLLRPPVFGIA